MSKTNQEIGLTETESKSLLKELDECSRPIFFFDNDADGLASFLLLYRYKKDGRGIPVKGQVNLDDLYARKAKLYQPDKIFILDLANVSQDFIDKVKVPIVWVDHHNAPKPKGLKIFNPILRDEKYIAPTCYLCYQAVKQDLWIAMTGFVGDWFLEPLDKEFRAKYPDLISKEIKSAPDALYNTPIGTLVHTFLFILKGNINQSLKLIKILTRLDDPYELLEAQTSRAKLIKKHYLKYQLEYEKLLKSGLDAKNDNDIYIYIYDENNTAFSIEISNELLYRLDNKVIIVGRKTCGKIKCSLRSQGSIVINKPLEIAISGLNGTGGGHPNACGLNISEDDFEVFLEKFRAELTESFINYTKQNN
jgi:single-stranded DNA-specific DHH superfamily exonuclease